MVKVKIDFISRLENQGFKTKHISNIITELTNTETGVKYLLDQTTYLRRDKHNVTTGSTT